MSGRTASRLSLALLALGAILTSAILLLGLTRGDDGRGLTSFTDGSFVWFVNLLLFLPVGALVASRHPLNPVGWLMCAIGMSEVVSRFTYEHAARALVIDPGSLPGGAAMAWLSSFIWLPQICLLPFLILLFPSGFLAFVYSGLVVALQSLVGRAQQPPLVVAVSTLAAAALFRPARVRIQNLIDRRFNLRRYDAVRTIEGFTARLRDEIDLDALTAHLLDVVNETMEPARISLWLKGRKLSGDPVG